MKSGEKNNVLAGIKKEQLKRSVFTLEFKAEVVRHKKAENLSASECGRKFDVLPKLVPHWEKQYEAGKLAQAVGRRAVSPEQAEITRLRDKLTRARMEVSILKKQRCTSRKRASEVHLYSCRTLDVPTVGRLQGAWRDPNRASTHGGPGCRRRATKRVNACVVIPATCSTSIGAAMVRRVCTGYCGGNTATGQPQSHQGVDACPGS